MENCADGSLGHLFYDEVINLGLFINIGDDYRTGSYEWISRYNDYSYIHFITINRFQYASAPWTESFRTAYYWAVRPGDSAPLTIISEPISSILFMVGGAT